MVDNKLKQKMKRHAEIISIIAEHIDLIIAQFSKSSNPWFLKFEKG